MRFALALLIAVLAAVSIWPPALADVVPAPTIAGVTSSLPGSATVVWNADPNDNNLAPITHFLVRSSQGPSLTVPVWTLNAIINGLAAMPTTFTVEAFSSNGSAVSAPSAAITPLPIPAGSPGPPTGIGAQAGLTSALVTWTPATGGGVSGYRVLSPVGVSATASGSTANAAKLTGLGGLPINFLVASTGTDGGVGEGSLSGFVTPQLGGRFHSLNPSRILDTRDGTGGVPAVPLGANDTLAVQVGGQGGIPITGTTGVVLNVTVTNTTSSSFLTVWPAGDIRPLASNLNWVPGETVANLVVVSLSDNSQNHLKIYNLSGSADVIFDVAGWVGDFTDVNGADGYYNPVPPSRLLDTRKGRGPVGPGQVIDLRVTAVGGVPASGVSAVALNVTVTNPTDSSYLTAWPTGSPRPLASNLNFVLGQTVPNRVIVQVGTAGLVSLFNFNGNVDVVVDVNGWYTDTTNTSGGSGLEFFGPFRMEDTRNLIGPRFGPLGPGQTFSLSLPAVDNLAAMVVNVTATNPTAFSYLTLYPDDAQRPLSSDVNFVHGETVPNLTLVKVGPARAGQFGQSFNSFVVFNFQGSVDVVVDAEAIFTLPVPPLVVSSAKVVPPAVNGGSLAT